MYPIENVQLWLWDLEVLYNKHFVSVYDQNVFTDRTYIFLQYLWNYIEEAGDKSSSDVILLGVAGLFWL
jgi:hypothetical protein